MKELDIQEVFSRVTTHLRTQGEKSMMPNGSERCAYKSESGLKCAVGCLIPDSEYLPTFEYMGVREIPVFEGWDKRTLRLMYETQCIHDHSHPHEWDKLLHSVANTYDLTMPLHTPV